MEPFVKWAGGKRQLLSEIKRRMPNTFDNYFEPFLGGGAVLFGIEPKRAVIGDVNRILVAAYLAIRDNLSELLTELNQIEIKHNESIDPSLFYYDIRKKYNEEIHNDLIGIDTIAMFIYLNKACYNGLYRVNSKGLFNVPFNGKSTLKLIDERNTLEISKFLSATEILCGDFENTCEKAKDGDFVFFDSPYDTLKPDSFDTYSKGGFSKDEHIRLARLYKKLSDLGCYCMLTNHNTPLINELYKDYKIEVIPVQRLINRNSDGRTGEEVIITNYELL